MRTFLLVFSTALLLISPTVYAISIIRGKTRPHRLTRLAVMAALVLSFFTAFDADANLGALIFTGIGATQAVVIFLLCLWRGMGGTSVFDWSCFLLAIVGIAAWQISGSPIVGLWFAIFADVMAYLPAFVKTWKHPHTETHWYYSLSLIATLTGLIAYPLSAASAFQIYIIACSAVMLLCIYHCKIFSSVASVDPSS